MNSASVVNEVQASPGIASEELGGEQVALEAITRATGGDEIARGVYATLCERKNVIDRRDVVVEWSGAVDTAPPAITHHGVLDGALLVAAWRALGAFGAA